MAKVMNLLRERAREFAYLDEIVEWLTQHSPNNRPKSIDEIRLRIAALGNDAGVRRRLSQLENAVVSIGESDDPLIAQPPRLIEIDPQGRVLKLRLSTAVTNRWVQAFQNTHYQTSLMGAGPSDFSFDGDCASLTVRYSEPNKENLQHIIDDFRRFRDLGARAYKESVEREQRQQQAEAQRQHEAQLKAERERLALLQQLRI